MMRCPGVRVISGTSASVPFFVGEWAEDFKRAFHDEVATAVGQIVGKRLAKELWPNKPPPDPI